MRLSREYRNRSAVTDLGDRTELFFVPDAKRTPFFVGDLKEPTLFRDAMAVLNEVSVDVGQDRTRRADEPAASRTRQALTEALLSSGQTDLLALSRLRAELDAIDEQITARLRPFRDARSLYFLYRHHRERKTPTLFGPVVAVHPDEISFECLGLDQATYARVSAGFGAFRDVGETSNGTSYIDYFPLLHQQIRNMRTHKDTRLEIDRDGHDDRGADSLIQLSGELSQSWMRAWLRMSTAMTLPATRFELRPMDVHNLCLVLRKHRDTKGPTAMRYHLVPERPIKVVFEPWNIEVTCPRSLFHGREPLEVRVWGRRKLRLLEGLIPAARRFTVFLIGSGRPSFYVADLGDIACTLGISGWQPGGQGVGFDFDLLAERSKLDGTVRERVWRALTETWVESPADLARRIDLERAIVTEALIAETQAGRAIFDLCKDVYRVRELHCEALPMERLRFASEREARAVRYLDDARVVVKMPTRIARGSEFKGRVRGEDTSWSPRLVLDADGRITDAECSCDWHQQNKLLKGHCEHILAVRLACDRGPQK